MISYIIAMNNTYALMSNFFGFLLPSVKPDDEIIIACDGCDSTATMDYLNSLAQIDLRIRLIKLKEKLGFAKVNNLAVNVATSETLVFINTDVFPNNDCINKMICALNSDEKIAAVQPLLLYPQSGLVQSTGHVFSEFKSGHLFSMRKSTDKIIKQSASRQALTMALCAVKKKVFWQLGGFNETYFNSHEGMELTLKMSLHGYICMYCAEAIAYHCSGVARQKTAFDISRQRAYFYQQWHSHIINDLEKYLSQQINFNMDFVEYIVYNLSSSTSWRRILEELRINYEQVIVLEERFDEKINLYDCISFTSLHYPGPYLFLCDSFSQIASNDNWIRNRNNPTDLVLDLNGNLLRLNTLIQNI